MSSADIVIVGGGMAGLSLACGLQASGLDVVLLEQRTEPTSIISADPYLRVSAINFATERLLRYLGVWHELTNLRLTPYRTMEVWERDSFARISFNADEYGYSYLGHIVENEIIQRVLWQKAQQSGVKLFSSVNIKQIIWGDNEVFLQCEGQNFSTKLVVGADGAHSLLRQFADIPLSFRDYEHQALVATVRTQYPHDNCARQVFYQEGILAFLPLWQDNLVSIVWSVVPEQAERLCSLSLERFSHELAIISDYHLGECYLQSERLLFPLVARYARDFARHRLVLVGDAAHTIHPLAGQGANLGFQDVIELLTEIKRLRQQGKDFGDYMYLRRYERQRKYDAAVMLMAMQGLKELFSGSHQVKKLIRGLGLGAVEHLSDIKAQIVRQATGITDLPDWLS